jgi:hypothetical protein
MLPFFKEQAVSITAHRFGNPLAMLDEVFSKVTTSVSSHSAKSQ